MRGFRDAIHNIIVHPAMELMCLCGLGNAALRMHDATSPILPTPIPDELWHQIADLCGAERKNQTQRTLKLNEEVGELARAVLAFQRAPGFEHRPGSREELLDEVADVITCAISVAASAQADGREIEEALRRKVRKWKAQQVDGAALGRAAP